MALKDLSKIEQSIIDKYLDRIEAMTLENSDVRVRVFDGEASSYIGSFVRSEIAEHFGATDETTVSIMIGGESHWTLFIHGNDEDVISDSGWTHNGESLEKALLEGVV